VLEEQMDRALLFKDLATLRTDAPIDASAEAVRWHGPRADFEALSVRLGVPALAAQAREIAGRSAAPA
jgi:hypothetical protein